MKSKPELSIITVNFNGIEVTRGLVDSLQEHLNTCNYELIIVDNGSGQNEADQLRQLYPHVTILRSEQNLGFAGGNNLGIRIARGQYILLLNNDTTIVDDSLRYLCETLKKNPQIGAVSPKIRFAFPPQHIQFAGFTPMSKYTLRNRSIGYNEPDNGRYDVPHATSFLHGAALMFRKEIIGQVGEMPEIYFLYYEEMDWCSNILRHGYQLWYDPRCTVYHKESSSTGQDSPLKTYYLTRNRLLYAWRNRSGTTRTLALLYQLCIANSKNIILNLLKGKSQHIIAIIKGCRDCLLLKNKYI